MIKYDDAVREGKIMVANDENNQWRWGEIAANLEPVHKESTLEQYAEDVGKEYVTLRHYKAMWIAWEGTEIGRRRPISATVAMELAGYGEKEGEANAKEKAKERRVALVERELKKKKDEKITKKEAREHTRKWKEEHGSKPELNLHQLTMRVIAALDKILPEETHNRFNAMLNSVVANLDEINEDDRKLLIASAKGVAERAEDLIKLLRPMMKSTGTNIVSINKRRA